MEMRNDHEIEFQEIKSLIYQKIKKTIRRLKFSFFMRSNVFMMP